MNSTAEPSINAEFIDSERSSFAEIPRNYDDVFGKKTKGLKRERVPKKTEKTEIVSNGQTALSYTHKHIFYERCTTLEQFGRAQWRKKNRARRKIVVSTNNDIIRKNVVRF